MFKNAYKVLLEVLINILSLIEFQATVQLIFEIQTFVTSVKLSLIFLISEICKLSESIVIKEFSLSSNRKEWTCPCWFELNHTIFEEGYWYFQALKSDEWSEVKKTVLLSGETVNNE